MQYLRANERKFECQSKGAIELGELESRHGLNKVSQFSLEHQSRRVRNGWRKRAANHLLVPISLRWSEPEYCSVNWSADHRRHIIVFGNKGPGDDNVVSRFGPAFGDPLASSVNLPSPHDRACSAISARAWRASCLRCFRKITPSLASVARRRSAATYWRNAVRTSAVRLRRRDHFSVSSSRSFAVASSMAMVFMGKIISAILDGAQVLCSIPGSASSEKGRVSSVECRERIKKHDETIILPCPLRSPFRALLVCRGAAAGKTSSHRVCRITVPIPTTPGLQWRHSDKDCEVIGYIEGKNILTEYRFLEGEPRANTKHRR